MYKLDLEKAEEPEIKLPASVGLRKNLGNSKKSIHFCFIDYAKVTDYVDHDNYMKFLKKWNNRPSYMPPEKLVFRSRSNRIRHETTDWFKIGKGV